MTKLDADLKVNNLQSKLHTECEKLQKEVDKYKTECDLLRETVEEHQRQQAQALEEKAEKENQVKEEVQATLEQVMNHPAFKKLVHAIKQLQKEKRELQQDIANLEERINRMEVVDGSLNQLKHFQKIKVENNFLKKELVSMFNENRRLKQSKGEDDTQSKSVKLMEMQCRKMKLKIEAKTKELKEATHSANKM